MKRRFVTLLVAAVALVLAPSVVLAASARSGDMVLVPKGEVHHGSLYIAGKTLTVDGDVDGDLVCAGSNVTVNGTVHGDVICAGQILTISGRVDGNVRLAGQTISLNGSVGRNAWVAGQTLTVNSTGKIDGELALLGQAIMVNGAVGRDLYGAMESLTLAAPVNGRVDVQLDQLNVASGAHVAGDLSYTSPQTFKVDGALVSGQVVRHDAPKHERTVQSPRENALAWLASRLYWMLATLAVALVLVWLLPGLTERITGLMMARPLPSIGWGLAIMFLGPIVLILLLVTVVGVPLAFLLGGAWIIALGLGGTLASLAVGRWLLNRTEGSRHSLVWAALMGVPVTVLVFGLPVVGPILSLVSAWWALGGLVLTLRSLPR